MRVEVAGALDDAGHLFAAAVARGAEVEYSDGEVVVLRCVAMIVSRQDHGMGSTTRNLRDLHLTAGAFQQHHDGLRSSCPRL